MINRNKMKKRYSLLELLLIVFMITVGFALLSTTLKINGTAGLKSNSWNTARQQDKNEMLPCYGAYQNLQEQVRTDLSLIAPSMKTG